MKTFFLAALVVCLAGCQASLDTRIDSVREQGRAAFAAGCEESIEAGRLFREALSARYEGDLKAAKAHIKDAQRELNNCD